MTGAIDFTLNLPFKHLSYTQVNTYLNNPKEYMEQYILGKDWMAEIKKTNPRLWDKVTLGGIIQDAISDPRVNWIKKLRENGFTSDKERIIKTALNAHNLVKMAPAHSDKKIYVDYCGIPLVIKPDGWDGKTLLETKFGAPRNQERIDDDLQISTYVLGLKIHTGKMPKKIVYQVIDDKTGKIRLFETTRRDQDLDHVGNLIIQVARGISERRFETVI